jgi:hypothetical protein
MSDFVGMLQATITQEVFKRHCGTRLTAEVTDLSMEPFLRLRTEGPDEFGIWQFQREFVEGSLWKVSPFSVLISPEGWPSFRMYFAWHPEGVRVSTPPAT